MLNKRFPSTFASAFASASALAFFLASTIGCNQNPYQQGQVLYDYHCAGCHSSDGSGLAKLIPALDSATLKLGDPAKLICLIKNGIPMDSLTRQQMPPNQKLTETEFTNLINYLGWVYTSKKQTITIAESQQMYDACQSTGETD